jgi:NAD(P)-dependent dehydrogenase (short-subunit alcohol dehydrogenase family)
MSSSDALGGQVALVTGAAAGIGLAVTRRFAAEGAHVVALDRDHDRLAELERELGAAVRTVHGDAGAYETNERAVAEALAAFGRLDILVGNAGVFDWGKRIAAVEPQALAEAFDQIFRVNVKAQVLAARAAAAALKAARGSAIFTCSNASFRAGGGGALYTASKFAVRGLVLQLSAEWAPDVRVNGVAPGGTVTRLAGVEALGSADRVLAEDERMLAAVAGAAPLGFAAQPEDHAALYVTLAARHLTPAVTGAVFVSDGGLTVSI